jgi:hypothetical protein
MRAVVSHEFCGDFMDQLEKNGVDSSHIRRCVAAVGN